MQDVRGYAEPQRGIFDVLQLNLSQVNVAPPAVLHSAGDVDVPSCLICRAQ